MQPLDRGHFIPAKVCEGPKGKESDTFFGIKDSRNNKEERARHGTGIMVIHTLNSRGYNDDKTEPLYFDLLDSNQCV